MTTIDGFLRQHFGYRPPSRHRRRRKREAAKSERERQRAKKLELHRRRTIGEEKWVAEWLTELMAKGDVSAAKVYRLADDANISTRTLKKIKRKLGIPSEKRGHVWYWCAKP